MRTMEGRTNKGVDVLGRYIVGFKNRDIFKGYVIL